VLGSIMATLYGGKIVDASRALGSPATLRQTAGDSLAAALQIAERVGGAAGAGIARTAQDAFVNAFQVGSVVTGAVALLGAAIALLFLPARSADEERSALVIEGATDGRSEVEPVLERV
jgi:hypothetical protein